MVLALFPTRTERYDVARLRYLYGNLLACIDLGHDLDRRSMETAPKNFSLSQLLNRLQMAASQNAFSKEEESESCDAEECPKSVLWQRELAAAFHSLQATKSTSATTNLAFRDPTSAAALGQAKAIEKRASQYIARIGEVVINAAQVQDSSSLRSDDAFAYFCEKNILSLFVDIVKDKPTPQDPSLEPRCFHGVVW